MSTKASWDIVRVVPLRSRGGSQSILRRVSTQAPHRVLTTTGCASREAGTLGARCCALARQVAMTGDVVGDSACLGAAQRAERRPAAPHRAGTLAERRGLLRRARPSPRRKLQPEGGKQGNVPRLHERIVGYHIASVQADKLARVAPILGARAERLDAEKLRLPSRPPGSCLGGRPRSVRWRSTSGPTHTK